ncbi:hypothetical protein PSENEW3n2_00000634 [Picochlorum sp. SENEW3]|nr:hypothetical protein PSENEW3n2_00000634 [Picochlorum sp. SENEW3]WPT15554.1 hypothetical protein PSENEW3_00000634 [Picochlorum sp. SENEW3]
MGVLCGWNPWIRKAPVECTDKVVASEQRMPMQSQCRISYTSSNSISIGSGLNSRKRGTRMPSSGLLRGVASSRQKPRHHGLARSEATESDTRPVDTDIQHQETQSGEEEVSLEKQGKRLALLKAQKSCSVAIEELDKPIGTYMTLPASQYSVLDARKIERIDEDTFRCYVGGFKFMSFIVEPVLTLSVVVGDRGPTVRLLETELQGSKAALEANKKFTATMQNIVQWQEDEEGSKCISSDTALEVTLEVPGWFVFPVSVVEQSGSAVMRKVLETAVPRFLKQLESDYALWSQGEERL